MLKVEIYDYPYGKHQSPGKEITRISIPIQASIGSSFPHIPAKKRSGIKDGRKQW